MTRERHYIPESRQREKPKSKYFAIGHSMKRVEDTRLLTRSGTYADDVSLPNMAHSRGAAQRRTRTPASSPSTSRRPRRCPA